MATRGRTILGVDINLKGIRVVQMSGIWPNGQVMLADYVPMPEGAMQAGRIVAPDLAGVALRGLLSDMHVSTREAVMGIPTRAVMARVFEVPHAPDSELPALIAGEMAHYHLLPDDKGVFDYTKLASGRGNETAPLSVLLMAAEEQLLSGYRELAQHAGLRLAALEPILFAMYRAGYPQIRKAPFTTSVMIGPDSSEIAVVVEGEIGLYRRINIGSDDLVRGRKDQQSQVNATSATPGGSPGSVMFLVNPDETEPDFDDGLDAYESQEAFDEGYSSEEPIPPADIYAALDSLVAGSLATELERSLDYYRRRNPKAGANPPILLTTDDPELDTLPRWLSERLELEVTTTSMPHGMGPAASLDPHSACMYMGAAGLAMRNLPGHPDNLPRFDLMQRRKQVDPHVVILRRKVATTLAATTVIAVLGLGIAFPLDSRVTTLEHLLTSENQSLASKQAQIQERMNTQQSHQEELDALRAQTIPFAPIVDAVVGSIDPNAHLSSISLEPGGKILLVGEAPNESSIVNSLNGLRASPFFDHPTLDSYHLAAAPGTPGAIMQFQVSAPLAGSLTPVSTSASPSGSPQIH